MRTLDTLEMLYSRRLIQSDAIGMPTDWPTMIRVAGNRVRTRRNSRKDVRTYVAPNRSDVKDVVVPNDGVDELIQTTKGRPYHVVASARVPGVEVPWEGDKHKDESQNRDDRVGGPGRVSRDHGVDERVGVEVAREVEVRGSLPTPCY